MKILKWTSTKEYYSEEDGTQLTELEVKHYYIIKKTERHVKLTEKINSVTKQTYQEGKITYTHICTRNGKQQRLFEY